MYAGKGRPSANYISTVQTSLVTYVIMLVIGSISKKYKNQEYCVLILLAH